MKFGLACVSLFALITPAVAQQAEPQAAPTRVFDGSDLFGIEVGTDPQISPDGARIAYVRRSGDIMIDRMRPTIWLVDTASGSQAPLVAGSGSHMSPRWSPDGTRLAYISTAEGGGAQLYVRWLASGESVRVTGLSESPSSIAWSPDGRQIAYVMQVPGDAPRLGRAPPRPDGAQWAEPLQQITAVAYRADGEGIVRPGFRHVFVVPADGGAPRKVTSGDFHHDGPIAWGRDGRTLYVSANRTADADRNQAESDIHAISIESGAIRRLTTRSGPDGSPVVSPDGSQIAYLGYDDRNYGYTVGKLYVMNADGSGSRVLTANLDREVGSPVWAADGRSIYFSHDQRGTVSVARVGLDGRISTVIEGLNGGGLDRPYAGGDFTVARDGTIAFTQGGATTPSEINVLRNGARRQLTRLNDDLLGHKAMGQVVALEAPSSHDGRVIQSWLTLPPGHREGQRHPLILEIHGGPWQAYGPNFSTDNQLFAAAGYAVLSVNPRGSTSYGQEFADLIHLAYPGNDYDDLISAVDHAIARGYVDPDQLYVTGGSGGGVLSSWIIGRNNRFRAAAVQKPVINWTSFALTSDGAPSYSRYWMGGFPWENQAAYWARSPLSQVGNIATPALVIVGAEDNRTPSSEAEQLYNALQLRGVPTALIRIPGATHNLVGRPSQNAARVSAILDWFNRYRRTRWTPPAAQ